jgi:hypothetical protein
MVVANFMPKQHAWKDRQKLKRFCSENSADVCFPKTLQCRSRLRVITRIRLESLRENTKGFGKVEHPVAMDSEPSQSNIKVREVRERNAKGFTLHNLQRRLARYYLSESSAVTVCSCAEVTSYF